MKVTLSHEEVLEACKEWVERHYGVQVKGVPELLATLPNNAQVYALNRVSVTFPEAPKPEGGPYRTAAER